MSVAIASAIRPATIKRMLLVNETNKRLSTLSTTRPMGIAKSSQGSMTSALNIEMRTGSFVRLIASSGAAVAKRPSARLLMTLAEKRRLKAGPNFSAIYLAANWIPSSGDHLLCLIRSPRTFKVWVNAIRRFQNIIEYLP